MRNFYIILMIGASAMFGYCVKKIMDQRGGKHHTLLDEAGIPDQLESKVTAQASNADMVSEGSVYGVQYYNKAQETQLDE